MKTIMPYNEMLESQFKLDDKNRTIFFPGFSNNGYIVTDDETKNHIKKELKTMSYVTMSLLSVLIIQNVIFVLIMVSFATFMYLWHCKKIKNIVAVLEISDLKLPTLNLRQNAKIYFGLFGILFAIAIPFLILFVIVDYLRSGVVHHVILILLAFITVVVIPFLIWAYFQRKKGVQA